MFVQATNTLTHKGNIYRVGDIIDVNHYSRVRIAHIANKYLELDCSTKNNARLVNLYFDDICYMRHFKIAVDPLTALMPRF